MNTTTLATSIEIATTWATKEAEINHLQGLVSEEGLTSEQEDFIHGYLNHLSENLVDYEGYLLEADEGSDEEIIEMYWTMRKKADSLSVKPSEDFLTHLNNSMTEMTLDGIDFQIKKAVDEFNYFYFGGSICMNGNGYVTSSSLNLEPHENLTVFFTKKDQKKITVEEVKAKIEKMNDTLIDDTNMRVRTRTCLRRHGIKTVSELSKMSQEELGKVRNLGMISIEEINEFLANK